MKPYLKKAIIEVYSLILRNFLTFQFHDNIDIKMKGKTAGEYDNKKRGIMTIKKT